MAIVIKVLMEEVIRVKSQRPHDYTNEQENNEVDLPGFDHSLHYEHEDLAPILEYYILRKNYFVTMSISRNPKKILSQRIPQATTMTYAR